jgi:hypothetical protein
MSAGHISSTRHLSWRLRQDPNFTRDDRLQAAAAIDALLDAIEAGGMVQARQVPPVANLDHLRNLRAFNFNRAELADAQGDIRTAAIYRGFVASLNCYFPYGDAL